MKVRAVARHEQAPETWEAPMAAELTVAGAGSDADLIAPAQVLMRLADAAGSRSGKYTVSVQGSQGVQIGDRNEQRNVFNALPTG
jgi:hypothetical protein